MEGPDAAYSAANLGANAGGKLYFKPSTDRRAFGSSCCGTAYLSSLLRRHAKVSAVSHQHTCPGTFLPRYLSR